MRVRFALAAAVFAVVATPAAAQADTRFYADSGDSCRYGSTQGTLAWGPAAVAVDGTATDRPTPTDPISCQDDRYDSTVTFTAYADTKPLEQKVIAVDNATVAVGFSLGDKSSALRADRLVIQVCRSPVKTLPPTYCGRAMEFHR